MSSCQPEVEQFVIPENADFVIKLCYSFGIRYQVRFEGFWHLRSLQMKMLVIRLLFPTG